MIFDVARSGCTCVSCGPSEYEGVGTLVRKEDGKHDFIMICSKCLFTGGITEEKWNKFLGKKEDPKPLPDPVAIKPRWMA